MAQMMVLILDQIEIRSEDEIRLLKIHVQELRAEFERLAEIDAAAMCRVLTASSDGLFVGRN